MPNITTNHAITYTNNLEFHLGYHTCWLNYFTLVCLWCRRTVGQCTVTWLPNFLGWVDHYIFLPMVLHWRASRARAPLLCLESFSWFLFLLVISMRFKGTVKRVKKTVQLLLQHFCNTSWITTMLRVFTTPRTKTFQLYLLHWMVKRRNKTSLPPPSDTLSARSFSWRQSALLYIKSQEINSRKGNRTILREHSLSMLITCTPKKATLS